MQQASCLEGGPLLWIWPLYLHVNQKSNDDDDDEISDILYILNVYVDILYPLPDIYSYIKYIIFKQSYILHICFPSM